MKYLFTTCLLTAAFALTAVAETSAPLPMATSGQPTDTTTGMTAGPASQTKTVKGRKAKKATKAHAEKRHSAVRDNLSNRNAAPENDPAAIDGEPSGAMGTVSPVETPMGIKRRLPEGSLN
jgi:hypothetical protein